MLHPKPGYEEIDPDWLWNAIIRVIQQCFKGRVFFYLFFRLPNVKPYAKKDEFRLNSV